MLLAGKDFVHLVTREAISCSVLECQQLSQRQLTLRLTVVWKISGDSWGNVRIISTVSLEDFPQSPYFLRLFCTKSVYIMKPSPPLNGQMQTPVSLLGYKASLVYTPSQSSLSRTPKQFLNQLMFLNVIILIYVAETSV